MIRKGKTVTEKETDLHKQAEEALRESEEKYRAIIENMEEGYHEVDIRGNFTFFNESMRKIIGYEREELLGMNNRQYSDEENAREVYQVYNRVYRTGEPVKNFEWKIIRKDGDRRDIEVSISLIRDREGHPTGFRGIVRDTTDRKKGEEALRDANWRMESIIEGTHVGTWEWNVQTGETVFNEVWAQIIGYTLKELAPISIKTWGTFAHPDDLKQSGELLERHFAGELPYYDYECRMKHKDGHWVWVHDRGRVITRTADRKPLMMFGIHTDITERKQIEEALRKNREDLRDAHRLAHIGIWHWVTDTDTVTWTEELYRIAGLDPILPAPTYAEHANIYAPESWDCLKVAVAEALKIGAPYQLELEIIRPDGTTRWVKAFGGATYDDHGRVTGLQGTVQDITERKLAEEERRLSEARLAEAQAVAKIGSWETDLLNLKVIWSRETYRIFEIDPDSFQSSHPGFLAFVHPDDRAKVDAAFTGSIGKHSSNTIEHRIVTPGGIVKFIEERWQIFHDEKGLPTRAVGTCQDITERKRVEEALRERDKQYHALFEAIADTVFLIDQETGRIIDVNPAATRMYEFNREEFLRMTAADVSAEPEKTAIATNEPVPFIPLRYHRHKDGSVFPVELTASIFELRGRNTIIATARDITAREQADEKLRESETRFRQLADSTWEGIIIHREGIILDGNEAILKMFGWHPEEVIGKSVLELLAPESIETALQKLGESIDAPQIYFEGHGLKKDKTVFPIEVLGRPIKYNSLDARVIAIRDITDRRQAAEALRESEAKYRSLVENVSDVIYEIDSQGVVVYISPVVRNIMGYDPADVVGKNFIEFVYEDDRSHLIKRFIELSGGIEYPSEYRLISKSGDIIWVRSKTNPTMEDRSFKGARGMLTDISDRKREEEEKRILQERIQRLEKMETLGNLAGGVAHDLNNILGILVGYSELLSHEIDENSPMRKYVRTIMDSGQRAAAVVQDLLTLARRGVVIRQTSNLNRIVWDQLKTPELMELTLSHPRIRIKPNCDEDLLNVKGSAVHISATLTNLVLNAAEAMPEGGVISIRTENRHLDRNLAGHEEVPKGDYAVMSVSDMGSGISPEDLKHIFEPFYTRKVMGRSGSGLGLSVVWGTMKDHDGYIDVTTARGKGTTFTLYFPVTPDEFIIEEIISVSEYLGKGESILVVDDEEGQRSLATRMLTKLKYKVTSVSSGEEAVEYLQQHDVDLVVLDMIMDPGIDGYETYRRIMELKKDQKAIIVSGFTETERVRMAKELGAGAFLKKPYLLERLGIAVRKELDKK